MNNSDNYSAVDAFRFLCSHPVLSLTIATVGTYTVTQSYLFGYLEYYKARPGWFDLSLTQSLAESAPGLFVGAVISILFFSIDAVAAHGAEKKRLWWTLFIIWIALALVISIGYWIATVVAFGSYAIYTLITSFAGVIVWGTILFSRRRTLVRAHSRHQEYLNDRDRIHTYRRAVELGLITNSQVEVLDRWDELNERLINYQRPLWVMNRGVFDWVLFILGVIYLFMYSSYVTGRISAMFTETQYFAQADLEEDDSKIIFTDGNLVLYGVIEDHDRNYYLTDWADIASAKLKSRFDYWSLDRAREDLEEAMEQLNQKVQDLEKSSSQLLDIPREPVTAPAIED